MKFSRRIFTAFGKGLATSLLVFLLSFPLLIFLEAVFTSDSVSLEYARRSTPIQSFLVEHEFTIQLVLTVGAFAIAFFVSLVNQPRDEKP